MCIILNVIMRIDFGYFHRNFGKFITYSDKRNLIISFYLLENVEIERENISTNQD